MIKAIIFDNNGVLTTSDKEETIPKFAGYLNRPLEEIRKIFIEEGKRVDIGEITTEEFLKNIMKRTNCGKKHEEILELYLSCYNVKKEVLDLAKKLKENFDMAVLTNFGDWFDVFNKKWNLDKIFGDKIFVSSNIGIIKPDKEIYAFVLKKLGMRPEETIFIDDNKENIESAREFGINAIQFINPLQLKEELKKLNCLK